MTNRSWEKTVYTFTVRVFILFPRITTWRESTPCRADTMNIVVVQWNDGQGYEFFLINMTFNGHVGNKMV